MESLAVLPKPVRFEVATRRLLSEDVIPEV
jgi:hypothetical protein